MAQRSWPWDSVDGDRMHGSSYPAAAFRAVVGDGYIEGYRDSLQVAESEPPGMSVRVRLGASFTQGRFFEVHGEPVTMLLEPADGTHDRIDRIVVRTNFTGRTAELAVIEGTPSTTPVAPALQRDSQVWESSLARIRVFSGTDTIEEQDILDERRDPLVSGPSTLRLEQPPVPPVPAETAIVYAIALGGL